jgi:hypothetical protein
MVRNRNKLVKKRKIEYRDRVRFQFVTDSGVYKNDSGRIKIDSKGYLSFLIKKEDKWTPVKGKLEKFKIVKEQKNPVGSTTKTV